MLRFAVSSFVAALVLGCGPGSFEGEVAGYELDVRDAVFMPADEGEEVLRGVTLILTDFEDACADFKARRLRRESTFLYLHLIRLVGSSPEATAVDPDDGTYAIVDSTPTRAGRYAAGGFMKLDATCDISLRPSVAEVESGTIDVEKIELDDDGRMTGSFDLVFGEQHDEASGSFNAAHCAAESIKSAQTCE